MSDTAPPIDSSFNVRPSVTRIVLHASITEEQIGNLVEQFYQKIECEPRLGAIFLSRNGGNWLPHLARMKEFWSSVLLHTGQYKGKPVPVHMAIEELQVDDFKVWLELFRQTAAECFDVEAVPVVVKSAERIARSLWMAKFATPFDQPPVWMDSEKTVR